MNENGIDDLLKVVSPELVAAYQSRNLDGWTLQGINEEYKAVAQNPWEEFFDSVKLVMFSLLVGLFLYFYLWIFTDTPASVAFIAMVVIIAPASFYFFFPSRWKFVRDNETRFRCESILRDFREAVEALNVPLAGMMEEYNKESIHDNLIVLVLWLLRAEASFKQIRLMENIPAKTVISYGEAEEACRKHFETMLSAAEKFGLAFNKAELFREGMNHREHMKTVC